MKSTELAAGEKQAGPIGAGEDRKRLFEARDMALGGLFGALAIVVPMLFHAIPQAGPTFLPMYLPILALGLLASWEVVVIVACAAPVLSSVLTGMPPPPMALLMVFELTALSVAASLVRARGFGIWPGAIAGVVAARIVGIAIYASVGGALGFDVPLVVWVGAGLVRSLPGVVLLLTVVPGAVYAIEKTSIIGARRREG